MELQGARVIAVDGYFARDVFELDVRAPALQIEVAFEVGGTDEPAARRVDPDILSDMAQPHVAAPRRNIEAAVQIVNREIAGATAGFHAQAFGDRYVQIGGDLKA